MDQPNANQRPRRRGVKRTICLGLLVTAILIAIAAYRHVVDPVRIRRLAIDQLERITQRKVEIGSASFSLRDGIQLRDVYLSNQTFGDEPVATPPWPEEGVFTCHEISILQNSWALLRGKLEIESFEAIRPTLTLVHDANVGWAHVASLLKNLMSRRETTNSAPPIELRHARVKILHRSPEGEREVEDFQLTVRGRRDSGNPRIFDIVWQDANDPDANGHTQVDLETGFIRNIRGGLPAMSIRGVLLAVDAGYEGTDAITARLGIEGRVRVLDYNLLKPPLNEGPRSATIDLRNAAISIPISDEERGLKLEDRYLHFRNVSGTVVLTASDLTANFDADFRGSRCKVAGTIEGPIRAGTSFDDMRVRGEFHAPEFLLPNRERNPQERRFIDRWPAFIRFFERYDPHGRVDLVFRAEKQAGPGEKFRIREAQFAALGADASWYRFPYRVSDLSGVVTYDVEKGIDVRQICGRHHQTDVCVNGWVESPKGDAQARFIIDGKGVNIDEDLLRAMQPEHRRWVDEYSLTGTTDVAVSIQRERTPPEAAPNPWDTIIQLDFANLGAIVPKVPLPVTQLVGQATVWPDRLEFTHARGVVASGVIELAGYATLSSQGLEQLSLSMDVEDARLEPASVEKLPPDDRTQIEFFDARGCASIESKLQFDAATGWRHDSNVRLRNLELQHEKFPLPIERAFADLHVTPHAIAIERARGFYDHAELFAKGDVTLEEDVKVSVTLEVENLVVDDGFRGALPKPVRDALSDWRVEDSIDGILRVNSIGDEFTWTGQARLDQATVFHRRLPRPIHQVDAMISFGRNEVRSSNITGRYEASPLTGHFAYEKIGEGQRAQISLRADKVVLDDSIRSLVPPGAQRVWDSLGPTGRADLRLDEFVFLQGSPEMAATRSLRGVAHLRDVSVSNGDAIIQSGDLHFDGMVHDRLGGVTLRGNIRNSRLQLFGQPVVDAHADWMFARTLDGRGRTAISDFGGRVHGGTASMQGQIHFDEKQADYQVATSLQNVDLAAWLESWRERNSARDDQDAIRRNDKPSDVRGVLGAQMHLGGIIGKLDTRTGGGRVEVRDGYIYKLPIFLAILNVLNINVPSQDVLSEASGQFYITGNSVRIADIDVTGESLSLVGGGTLSLGDESVDLRLVNAGAGRLEGIPVLAELWKGASRELVELRVTGPVSQPQVRAMPFGGVTDEFKKLFQKRKPRRSLQTANP